MAEGLTNPNQMLAVLASNKKKSQSPEMASMDENKPEISCSDVRSIQALLYSDVMKQTLTLETLDKYKLYLDKDIRIECCPGCLEGNIFENINVTSSILLDNLDEHVKMIQTGYCSHTDNTSGNEVMGIRLIHSIVRSDSNMPFLKFLCKHSCDLNIGTLYEQYFPIMVAIEQEQSEILKYLIQNGADVNKIYVERSTGFLVTTVDLAILQDYGEILEILLSAEGLDINKINSAASTQALTKCVNCNQTNHVKALLEAGADPNICGLREKDSPLMNATQQNNYDLMKLLIEYGADPNYHVRNFVYAQVPLQFAVLCDDLRAAKLLLEAGADPNYCTHDDQASLITQATYSPSSEVVELLIEHGADVNIKNDKDYMAIHFAAWHGKTDTVQILLAAGSEFDPQTEDKNTPLAFAANGGDLDTMKVFLPLGCNVNNVDKDEDTPMHYASYNGMKEGVKLLIQHGANPDARNRVNTSPLWNAVYNGYSDIVLELLLANVEMEVFSTGRNPLPSDIDMYFYDIPRSPLYVAIEHDCKIIVMLLIAAGYNIHAEKWFIEGNMPYSEDNAPLVSEVTRYIQTPNKLLIICRNFFRSMFGLGVCDKADRLEIPRTMKDCLKLKHLLENATKMSSDFLNTI